MNVQSILARKGSDVATVTQHASLADAAAKLRDHGVGALVVSAGWWVALVELWLAAAEAQMRQLIAELEVARAKTTKAEATAAELQAAFEAGTRRPDVSTGESRS